MQIFGVFLAPRIKIYPAGKIVRLGVSAFVRLKAGQSKASALPLFGELTQRSVAEG